MYASCNTLLQELRFFGAALDVPILRGLLQGVKEGFRGLRVLEFSIQLSGYEYTAASARGTTPASLLSTFKPAVVISPVSLAEAVIETAKDRAYAGRPGLAVTVNSR